MKNVHKVIKKAAWVIGMIVCGMCVASGCTGKSKVKQAEGISPIIDQEGADPYVMKHGDWYYYTKTTGSNITLWRSHNLTDVAAGETKVLYEPASELADLWAPEIFCLDDVWYVYFAARTPGEEMHYMYALVNESEDPFEGEWTCQPVKGMDDKFAIDGTVMELPSGRYFVWSGWEGDTNVRQDIYLAEMVSPTEVLEEKILLSKPEYEWEKVGEPLVNEGPAILVRKNTINLVYSASGSWTDDYCLGLLTADVNSDVKSPESWTKQETSILSKGNEVWGPGHNSFTVSPDEKEDIIVYHAARWEKAGWSRSVRYDYVSFDEKGQIKGMEPSSSDAKLKVPSGEKTRYLYEEEISLGEEIELDLKEGATVYVYAKADQFLDDKFVSIMELTVNGKVYQQPVYPSEYFQPTIFHVEIPKGKSTFLINSETGAEDFVIDRIEIQ